MLDELKSIDPQALERLQELRQRQSVLADRLERIEEKRDEVSPEVYRRVSDDYRAKAGELADEASPFESQVASDAHALGKGLEQARERHRGIELDLEEATLRHELGEYDDSTYEERQQELDARREDLQRDIEQAEETHRHMLDALPEALRDQAVEEAIAEDEAAEGSIADDELDDDEADQEPIDEAAHAETGLDLPPSELPPTEAVRTKPDEPAAFDGPSSSDDDAQPDDAQLDDAASLDLAPVDTVPGNAADAVASSSESEDDRFTAEPESDDHDSGDPSQDPQDDSSFVADRGTAPIPDPPLAADLGDDDRIAASGAPVPVPPPELGEVPPLDLPAPPDTFETVSPGPEDHTVEMTADDLDAQRADMAAASQVPEQPASEPRSNDSSSDSSDAAGPTEDATRLIDLATVPAPGLVEPPSLETNAEPPGATRVAPIATMTFRDDDGERHIYPLRLEPMTIGRTADNDIQVTGLTVSRRHARLEIAQEGFRLVDLGSENGVFVNGEPIREHILRDGDEIHIGSAEKTLLFEISG